MMSAHSASGSFVSLLDATALASAFKENGRLLLAVSGGADSVAMLRAVYDAARGAEVACVHVNHGLRDEADAEEAFVRDLCAQLSVRCYVRRLTGASEVRGGSAEGHWRKLRYDAFRGAMTESGSDLLLLGHTADDLAETFLFHLVRGTGLEGLLFSCEGTADGMRVLRPLWKTRRADIEQVLRMHGQTWMDDPSNADRRHSRNLIRHEVIPLLQKINPDAVGAIVRASEIIEGALQQRGPAGEQSDAGDVLQLGELRGSSDGALRERLRDFVAANGAALDSRQTCQTVQMVKQNKVGLISLAGAMTLVLTQDSAWLIYAKEPSDEYLAAEHTRRFGGLFARSVGVSETKSNDGTVRRFEVHTLAGSAHQVKVSGMPDAKLVLRNRYAGERVGSTPLKKILNEVRVPWYLREYVVFVVTAQEDRIVGAATADAELRRAVSRRVVGEKLQIE